MDGKNRTFDVDLALGHDLVGDLGSPFSLVGLFDFLNGIVLDAVELRYSNFLN